MQDERLYADHDLRVAKLADMVGLPEHSLRKKINKQLGYRNFNQFVNRYRIEEAGQRLNKEPTIPVLSVALDVGFRSISSFNTAFQSQFGMSPTEYRRQSLA
jgi:AraC-like DNA-binding protein